MKSFIYSIDQIDDAAIYILQNLSTNILLFEGEMGSGKTTLIKAIVKHLGSNDEVSSPTFAIVNEYKTPVKTIYHFDLYRLDDMEEALDFGIEEYLSDKNAVNLIEWPEIIREIIPDNSQKIRIIVKDFKTREIQIE
jgi:tRNA threonylcarbamoyladenosine biosynthesis protein TsaE